MTTSSRGRDSGRSPRAVHDRVGSRVSLNGTSNANACGSLRGIDVVSSSVVVDGGTVEGGLPYSFPVPAPGLRLAQGEVVATGGAVIRSTPFVPSSW